MPESRTPSFLVDLSEGTDCSRCLRLCQLRSAGNSAGVGGIEPARKAEWIFAGVVSSPLFYLTSDVFQKSVWLFNPHCHSQHLQGLIMCMSHLRLPAGSRSLSSAQGYGPARTVAALLPCLARLVHWISQMGLGLAVSPGLSGGDSAAHGCHQLAVVLLWCNGFVGEVLPCLCQGWPQLFCYLLWKESCISSGTPFSRQLKKLMLDFHPLLCVL